MASPRRFPRQTWTRVVLTPLTLGASVVGTLLATGRYDEALACLVAAPIAALTGAAVLRVVEKWMRIP